MVIPALSYSIIHSLSVGFVSVAIFPVDITILPAYSSLNDCVSSLLNFSSSVKTLWNPVNVPWIAYTTAICDEPVAVFSKQIPNKSLSEFAIVNTLQESWYCSVKLS